MFITIGEFFGAGRLVGIWLDDVVIVVVVGERELCWEKIFVVVGVVVEPKEVVGVETVILVEGAKIVEYVEIESVESAEVKIEISIEVDWVESVENVESVSGKVESAEGIFDENPELVEVDRVYAIEVW